MLSIGSSSLEARKGMVSPATLPIHRSAIQTHLSLFASSGNPDKADY
jgi:hypothetical protein